MEPVMLVVLTLVSAGGLKWCFRVIVEAIANSKRIKILRCDNCGELVHFDPPLKVPTRADLYSLAAEVQVAAAGGRPPPTIENSPGPRIYEVRARSSSDVEQLEHQLPDRVLDS